VTGFTYTSERAQATAARNAELLTTDSWANPEGSWPVITPRNEWVFNHGDRNAPPARCLAMSGGGVRSAAFNLGVLEALAELGHLDHIDVVSAVSGGSYALAYYYMQQYHAGRRLSRDELFRGVRMERLENSSSTIPPFWNPVRYVLIAENLLMVPVNLFANGIFGWHTNTTPTQWYYRNRLALVYQNPDYKDPYPLIRSEQHHSLALIWGWHFQETLENLGKFALAKGLPAFVINTTVGLDAPFSPESATLASMIFEFTPFAFGSDAFGFRGIEDDWGHYGRWPYARGKRIRVVEAIAASGAAWDNHIVPGNAQQILLSATNFDTGIYIDNPATAWQARLAHDTLVFPLYLASPLYGRNPGGSKIYLTDGGHSENLGAFSLLRRLCGEVTIVDAEYDPQMRFGSYQRLKAALRREMNVELSVPAIDQWLSRKPAESTPVRPAGSWDTPMMVGSVDHFPRFHDPASGPWRGDWMQIPIYYVKLATNADDLERLERQFGPERGSSRTYWQKSTARCDGGGLKLLGDSCPPFPQQPTTDQVFSPEQFKAYRDLGYGIVRMHYAEAYRAPGGRDARDHG
jgi:Patatin-like phospholipase